MAVKIVHVKAHDRKLYTYTKKFVEGPLKGMTIKQQSKVRPRFGEVVGGGNLGSRALISKRKRKGGL